jgi:3-deoxy-7-phosphoheptulonate synthase
VLAHDVDVLQIGTRNALNYGLLKEIGRKIRDRKTAVLLKRSMHMGKIEEFIMAAEYVVAQGNPNILLCPRGTTPAMDGYRNHPDECIAPLLKERTWAPVIVDPSHSVGKATYVPFACLAAASYGADGIIVEMHVSPRHGIGDDPKQAVTPDVLAKIVRDTRAIHELQKRHLEHLLATA